MPSIDEGERLTILDTVSVWHWLGVNTDYLQGATFQHRWHYQSRCTQWLQAQLEVRQASRKGCTAKQGTCLFCPDCGHGNERFDLDGVLKVRSKVRRGSIILLVPFNDATANFTILENLEFSEVHRVAMPPT